MTTTATTTSMLLLITSSVLLLLASVVNGFAPFRLVPPSKFAIGRVTTTTKEHHHAWLSVHPLLARPRKDDNEDDNMEVPSKKRASAAAKSTMTGNTSRNNRAAAATSSTTTSTKRSMDPAKQAALEGVLHQIEKNYGRGSIVKLGDADHMVVDCIGSGALTLDVALGGGYPKGRVVEIYGPESSGKTTLALHAIAQAQQQGGVAAFIDAEHALDPQYAAGLGVDVDALFVSQPDSGEMALDVVDQLVRSSAVDVIVVDSVAALVPRAELEGDMSDQQIGLQARLMSKAMRKITGSLPLSQCTVIFLNQLRSKIGVMYGSPEVTAGGNALKYYASVRLDTRRKEILPDNSGIRIKVKVVKNKVAPPFKAVQLDILFGSGLDKWGCMLDAALDLGIVDRKGSWYAYQGQNIAQGRASVIELFKQEQYHDDNDEGEGGIAQEIERQVRQALSSSTTTANDDNVNVDDDDDNEDSVPLTMRSMVTGNGMMEEEEAEVEEEEEMFLEA